MDDLSGLDFSASKAPGGNYYPTLRPTPPPQNSGRNTPLTSQGSGVTFAPPKVSTPDSFSSLVSFGSTKKATLSLQEQQQKLQADKIKKEAEEKARFDAQFGRSQPWASFGNNGQGVSTHATTFQSTAPVRNSPDQSLRTFSPAPATLGSVSDGTDDELFAAFNSDAPVDRSSYYPPPSARTSRVNTPALTAKQPLDLGQPQAWETSGSIGADLGDDDDPFGLGKLEPRNSATVPTLTSTDEDDFLGDLGKPVEEFKRQHATVVEPVTSTSDSEPESDDPWDKAVAELVDMGFSFEQSRRALTESGHGLNIQAAVGWILNDAHNQAKQTQTSKGSSRDSEREGNGFSRESSAHARRRGDNPAWMREDPEQSQPRREDSRSPNATDFNKTAAAVGNNLLKTANSLWKTSQKKVQKAVADFNQQDSDPSQPKWMTEAAVRDQVERKQPRKGFQPNEVTDEALMLEGGGRPSARKNAPATAEPAFRESRANLPRQEKSEGPNYSHRERPDPFPRWQQSAPPADLRSRVNKQAIEEQSAQAYISPARRKKATPQPSPPQSSSPHPEPDLHFAADAPTLMRPGQKQQEHSPRVPSPLSSKQQVPIPNSVRASQRQIPSVSPAALANSNQHRLAGTLHFKRGDYASAHDSFSTSMSSLPASHPITIVLLCNRALTSLKTGVPKSAVSDADAALELIGTSRGDGEKIDLGSDEGGGSKDMREFYGKALMRKAEALESLEKWKEAGEVWKLCVEHGIGAATAVQGRQRCEKALAPKSAPPRAATPKIIAKPKQKSALADLGSTGGQDSAAIKRLREANVAAEKADDEKFALSEKVESKIESWRGGKRDNLRALLGSLDNVMWEGAGWKKIGMHELVQNNKVKINYMKAIGKTHPDKLPQDASTEVRMIAALVFATLNESWDKFKQQNGL